MGTIGKWFVLLASIIVGAMLLGVGQGSTPAEQAQPLESDAALGSRISAEPERLTMVDLEKRIEENEVGAMAQLAGKALIIDGKVTAILLDADNKVVVNVDGNGLLPISVPLPDDDKAVAGTLKKGQRVTVTCYKLEEAMAKPVLDECRLNPPEDWPKA